MKVGKADTAGSQRVEGRCFHRATVTADILPSQVIGQQQDNIGMLLSRKAGCRDGNDQECIKDWSDHVIKLSRARSLNSLENRLVKESGNTHSELAGLDGEFHLPLLPPYHQHHLL